MGGFNCHNNCQKGKTTGYKGSWLLSRCINDNFLTPSWWRDRWEETPFWVSSLQMRKDCSGMRGLKAALVAVTMKLWSWESLWEGKLAGSQPNTLWLFQVLTCQKPMGYFPRERRKINKKMRVPGELTDFQSPSEQSNSMCGKLNKNYRRYAWMNKEVLKKLKLKKEARTDDLGGI